MIGGRSDVPPVFSAKVSLVKPVIEEEEDGHP
jgi:hypothetical protein